MDEASLRERLLFMAEPRSKTNGKYQPEDFSFGEVSKDKQEVESCLCNRRSNQCYVLSLCMGSMHVFSLCMGIMHVLVLAFQHALHAMF